MTGERLQDPSVLKCLMKILEEDQYENLRRFVSTTAPANNQNADQTKLEPSAHSRLTEMTFLDENSRNLLHFATMKSAARCVALLISPPNSWNPDMRDKKGWSSVQMAQYIDDIPTLCELLLRSGEQLNVTGRLGIHLMSFCLFWPQSFPVGYLTVPRFFRLPSRATSGHTDIPSELEVYGPRINGYAIALMYEMFLSNPELCDPFLGRGPVEGTDYWSIELSVGHPVEHENECKIYPRCLLRLWLMFCRCGNQKRAFQELQNVWIVHRFTIPRHAGGKVEYIGLPPTLKQFCRISLRRHLVRNIRKLHPHVVRDHFPNYARLVYSLHLPLDLREFLLYKDIWPTYQ
ncbi:unnamed protein product [Calicophoron daubneyi]|uniref:SOCS box domain-containing protein n=1 Tax=Calicophoron daubneyi TaxID=300641 RepID=A0AAV2TVI2_CALDB